MNVTPLGDRVIVRPDPPVEVLKSGIILPPSAQEDSSKGTVVAAGSGRVNEAGIRIPLDVKEGDRVLYGKFAGTKIKVEEEELLLIAEREIYAIIGE